MTVRRLSTRLLLGPGDVPASRDDFEVVGVFNPGAVRAGDEVVLLVRVAERPRERRPGFTGLPRWDPADGLDDRLGSRRGAGADRPAGGPAQGRRAGPAHLHLAPPGRPLRRRAGRAGGHGRHVPPARRSWRSSGSRTRGSRRSTAGSISPTSPSRGTARRRPWRPRPTSARSSGTGSSSAPRTRTWSCSRRRSAGPSRRCTGRSAARRSPGRRCGSRGRRT